MKNNLILEDISNFPIFKNISKKSYNKIIYYSDIFYLKKNQCLYTDNQKLNFVYFILEGKVILTKNNENGDNRIIFILSKGDMINQPIMRNNISAAECWGLENAKILKIRFEKFDNIMNSDYILTKNCMVFMKKRIRQLYRQLKNSLTNTSLEKKLASKLYRLAIRFGKKDKISSMIFIDLKLSTILLSKMIGCHRESISRAIKILSDKNLVKHDGKSFFINMPEIHIFLKKY